MRAAMDELAPLALRSCSLPRSFSLRPIRVLNREKEKETVKESDAGEAHCFPGKTT